MKTLADLTVGDEFRVVSAYRKLERATSSRRSVAKIGRVWITDNVGARFRIEDGYGSGDPAVDRALTDEQLDAEIERVALTHEAS